MSVDNKNNPVATDGTVRYELPNHRVKLLAVTIFGLMLFLIYTLLKTSVESGKALLFLISIFLISTLWFKKFISQHPKVGFLLNQEGIFNLDNSIVCRIEDIETIDTSPYTFRSANGFIVFLRERSTFKIVPGLYWRLGNRISIGGLVSKAESKFLSTTMLNLMNTQKKAKKTMDVAW